MTDSGADMNSTATNEQCERRIQSTLKELGFDDRENFVAGSTLYELIQGNVIDVTTMNLVDDLAQSKCEMMLTGQRPSLLCGGSKCAESGSLNESLKSLQFKSKVYERQRSEG